LKKNFENEKNLERYKKARERVVFGERKEGCLNYKR
jgi:hypothetical protein